MGRLREFLRWMRENPRLSAGSVNAYRKAVSSLVRYAGSDSPDVEVINRFIAEKVRARSPLVKYAIKHYLEFLGRGDEYGLLVQAKVHRPVRDKHFLPRSARLDIIDGMKTKMFRDVALLQEVSGARAREVLSIRRHRVSRQRDGVVKVMVMGKGSRGSARPRPIFLRPEYWGVLVPYMSVRDKAFLFLEPGVEFASEDAQRAALDTLYKRYLEDLQQSAVLAGFEGVGTHDFRRSKADELNAAGVDIRRIQILLGHSSTDMTLRYVNTDEATIRRVMLDGQGAGGED